MSLYEKFSSVIWYDDPNDTIHDRFLTKKNKLNIINLKQYVDTMIEKNYEIDILLTYADIIQIDECSEILINYRRDEIKAYCAGEIFKSENHMALSTTPRGNYIWVIELLCHLNIISACESDIDINNHDVYLSLLSIIENNNNLIIVEKNEILHLLRYLIANIVEKKRIIREYKETLVNYKKIVYYTKNKTGNIQYVFKKYYAKIIRSYF